MKLTPEQIAKIESVLSMYERGCTRPEIMLAYGIRDRAYVSAFRSFMCALGVDVPTYWMAPPLSESIDPVDRTYSHDFMSPSIGDARASRFRSASTGPQGRVPSAPMTSSAPSLVQSIFYDEELEP